jgi:hypothetical protein
MYVLNDEFYRFEVKMVKTRLDRLFCQKGGAFGLRSELFGIRIRNSASNRIQIHKAEGESFSACEKYSGEQGFSLEFLREKGEKRKSTKVENQGTRWDRSISRYCSLYVYTTVHKYAVSMNNSNFT